MSAKEELIRILEQAKPDTAEKILRMVKAEYRTLEILLPPSDNMQAAVRTVFQLFCKEDSATFTEFGAEEVDENPWSQHSSAHRWWLQVTEDMMKSCNIESAEEMIECLALMLDIIKSTNKARRKNEKAFGLYIYYISQEATDIEHLRSPEHWSKE